MSTSAPSPEERTRLDLAAIEKRWQATTQGQWEADTTKSEGSYGVGDDTHEGFNAYEIIVEVGGKARTLADSLNSDLGSVEEEFGGDEDGDYHSAWDETARCNFEFIANAHQDVPALIAECRALTAERDALKTLIADYERPYGPMDLAIHHAEANTVDAFIALRKRSQKALNPEGK